jgi:hypothetical protein
MIQIRPVIECDRCELGAVVALDDLKQRASLRPGVTEHPSHIVAIEARRCRENDAFAGVDVDQRETRIV